MKENRTYQFTSESVTEGHPDKMADQISDAVLDYVLTKSDKPRMERVACETLISNGVCMVAGELKTSVYVPLQTIARNVMKDIGYDNADKGCDYKSYGVLNGIGEQSEEIAQGVDKEGALGAGDQGLMFGYATNETLGMMPLPITIAHKLTRNLTKLRKNKTLPLLRPDGKSQVTVNYQGRTPVGIDTIVVSTQHSPEYKQDQLKQDVIDHIIQPMLDGLPRTIDVTNVKIHINPTGSFVVGGPQGDAGLTGRKIIVDTYGGWCQHGGGAFSGKDGTKVDRSAAYMARYIAKNLVAAEVADEVTIQLSYAIGVTEPTSIYVDSKGTGDDQKIEDCIKNLFDLTPQGIIDTLELYKPQFQETSRNGHFGNPNFRWEKLDRVHDIKNFWRL